MKVCSIDYDISLNPNFSNFYVPDTLNYVSSDITGTITSATKNNNNDMNISLNLDHNSIVSKPKHVTIQLIGNPMDTSKGIYLSGYVVINNKVYNLPNLSGYFIDTNTISISFHSFTSGPVISECKINIMIKN